MKELQGDCKNDISSHASLLSNDEAISLLDKYGRQGKAKAKKKTPLAVLHDQWPNQWIKAPINTFITHCTAKA